MSGRIPRVFIDDLLVRVDIVDLIDRYVPLKKSGGNFVALCPFHNEKTPSFSVSRAKQLYHCFGCGAGGNAISFLMDYSHSSFVEAVEELAAFVGVDVPREAGGGWQNVEKPEDSVKLLDLLGRVALCYAKQLRHPQAGGSAVAYLKSRGVSGAVAREFGLGYAPAQWRFLADQFKHDDLVAAGLLVKKDDGGVYDRFRARVIFPIRDRRGRVVGFGGRVLDNSLPKYLNSPETAVFQKGREVYGLYELLARNSKPKKILVVEGYMDVIALAQAGIDYAVAALGTATTKAHVDLLFRFTRELIFCFDGDSAGEQAAWRALDVAIPCLRDGRQIRIMILPQGADPDSLVREEGVERFGRRVASAYSMSDYFFEHLSQDLCLTTVEGRAGLVEKAKPYLQRLPAGVFQEMMYARLKEMVKVDTLEFFSNQATISASAEPPAKRRKHKSTPARIAIALLLQHPELISVWEQKNIDWAGFEMPGAALLSAIAQRILAEPQISLAGVVESFRGSPQEKQVAALAHWPVMVPEAGVREEFSGALDRLLERAREMGLERLIAKEKQHGLSGEERELLRRLLANKPR